MTTKTNIKGREYHVECDSKSCPRLRADLQARGFDGHTYFLTGKRGAFHMAYRSAKSGQFVIVG
tara:strand:+ start:352 stop:543 length:192 start_codon:yes stop_codon:yes gene_type:complete